MKPAPLPICLKCGQRPSASHEPAPLSVDAFWLFGCPCDDPHNYGFGPTRDDAEADWIADHVTEGRLALRRNFQALTTVACLIAGASALGLYCWPWPDDIVGLPRNEAFIVSMLFGQAVAALCYSARLLLETPAAVAAERRGGIVANLPHPTIRL